jgi:hypothetical protein
VTLLLLKVFCVEIPAGGARKELCRAALALSGTAALGRLWIYAGLRKRLIGKLSLWIAVEFEHQSKGAELFAVIPLIGRSGVHSSSLKRAAVNMAYATQLASHFFVVVFLLAILCSSSC